jgi:DNA helicase HerA-like ATPase
MNISPDCPINLDALMQTRALIVAGPGGGKSYALRKLIEETAGGVQQLVIDPEGEFASLRERHDFILVVARDGDIVASPKTAGVLAHRLLELGTSAILDLYELQVS